MKKYMSVTSLSLVLIMLACQESRVGVQEIDKDLTYYRSVGEEIPFETGLRWMDHYKNHDNGRTDILDNYVISASQVSALVASVSTFAGVAFHYGYDSNGKKHIIAIPIDESLSLWSDTPGRIYVDANSGNTISRTTANTWALNYRAAHPNAIWFHYFGGDVFDEMIALPYFDSIDIEQATNILDFTPQLLLIVWNDLLGLGRTSDQSGTIYDASNPCPPCGVHD